MYAYFCLDFCHSVSLCLLLMILSPINVCPTYICSTQWKRICAIHKLNAYFFLQKIKSECKYMWYMTTYKCKHIISRLERETQTNVPKIIFCSKTVDESQKTLTVGTKIGSVGKVKQTTCVCLNQYWTQLRTPCFTLFN